MASCTLWGGHLYGFDESKLKCIDLEGKELWRVRGLGQGALTIGDWREVEGVLLPFSRTVFDSESGQEQPQDG